VRKVQPSPGLWVCVPAHPEMSLPTLAGQTSPVALHLVFVCGKVAPCPPCAGEGEPRGRVTGGESWHLGCVGLAPRTLCLWPRSLVLLVRSCSLSGFPHVMSSVSSSLRHPSPSLGRAARIRACSWLREWWICADSGRELAAGQAGESPPSPAWRVLSGGASSPSVPLGLLLAVWVRAWRWEQSSHLACATRETI